MTVRGQEEKKLFIQELISKFEGAYELDSNKVVVIPYNGIELKATITVSKGNGGAAKKVAQSKTVAAPTEEELKELQDFVTSISDELPF